MFPPCLLQALANWLEHLLPYLGLMAAVFLYHYFVSVIACLWLWGVISNANKVLRQHLASRGLVAGREVASTAVYVLSNAGVVLWLASKQGIADALILRPPQESLLVSAPIMMCSIMTSMSTTCLLVLAKL